MSVPANVSQGKRSPAWIGIATSVAIVVAMLLIRLVLAGRFPLPIGYGVPIVLMAAFRSRRLLWSTTAAFAVLSIVKFFFLHPEVPASVHIRASEYNWLEGCLVLFDLLLVTAMVDRWIVTWEGFTTQNRELESANAGLAAREEEIARQNEELQSQTEELERQSEELRVSNEELVHRERLLEILLSLSRSLNTEMSRDEIMTRICQTLGVLIDGPATAAGILERKGDRMAVLCHHGFGVGGPRDEAIGVEESFASLIIEKGRTGYIEDISARPDLRIPQPKDGEPMVAVLATPLRVAGVPVGSLEVYSRQKTAWNQEQVGLIESLAAQASVSLEAAELFEDMNQERSRFEAVLRTAPVGIAVCDSDCGELQLNPAGAMLSNVPAGQRVRVDELAHIVRLFRDGKPLETDQLPLIRSARNGEDVRAEELELVSGDGRRIFVLMYSKPIRDAKGILQGAVAVFIDISAQKELQWELDTRRREAEEASVRKTRFLAAVSHDIRTPANAISLLAELIRRTASNPAMAGDVPELAQELQTSALSLVSLLSDVLDIARFDSDKVDLHESEFPLATLLMDEQKQLLPLAREKGLLLQFNAPAETLIVRTDRIKLSRVLGNLVGNAIKFTEAGSVSVDAHLNGSGTIRLEVTDTGIGIPPEHLTHIFDEFFQLRNPERDRAKGSGLGLTICRRLVDAMGGKIEVRSIVGQGTTFTVTLPAFATMPRVTVRAGN
jgi:signal transduction histidine kinase